MSTGPWMNDADPVWRDVYRANSADHTDSSTSNPVTQTQMVTGFGADWPTAAAAAWDLDSGDSVNLFSGADTSTGNGEFFIQDTSAGGAQVDWRQIWVTVTTADVTVASSTLPASVYDPTTNTYTDPTVTGVEWEPTSSPLAQEIDVTLIHGPDATLSVAPGNVFTVHVGGSGSGPYAPGLLTAAAIRGMTSPGTVTVASDGTWDTLTFTPSLPLTEGATLGVTMLDPYTESATTPAHAPPPGDRLDSPILAVLRRQYRPRYRLIYRTTVNTYLRTVQRGGDGLSGGAPRTVQRNSQQGSLRNIAHR